MVPFTSLFIDDLCVDAKARGQHIGESLFEYVKSEAKRLGCILLPETKKFLLTYVKRGL